MRNWRTDTLKRSSSPRPAQRSIHPVDRTKPRRVGSSSRLGRTRVRAVLPTFPSPSDALDPGNRADPLPRIDTTLTIHLALFFSYRIIIT